MRIININLNVLLKNEEVRGKNLIGFHDVVVVYSLFKKQQQEQQQ